MGIIKEFKTFAMRGNVLDLAVAVIIGTAFGKIITSLVNDIIMPPVGLLLGNRDFGNMRIILKHAREAVVQGDTVIEPAIAEVSIWYGAFINTILEFLIVAAAIFAVIKAFNSMKRKQVVEPTPPPVPTKEEILLTEIRDILKEKK